MSARPVDDALETSGGAVGLTALAGILMFMLGGWWIIAGPNGGYLAGILLRALAAAVGDDARIPRSLTIHYLRPPKEGPCRIHTQIERTGRSMTTVTGRLSVQLGSSAQVRVTS